jgi:hypothetical protein
MTIYPIIHLCKAQKYDNYELVDACMVEFHEDIKLYIPAGYTTDFATVPQLFWSLCPPHGRAAMPSVVHDYMYDNRVYEDEVGERKARRFADEMFLKHMKEAGVPKWQRYTYYFVVRWFAGPWWRG